MRNNFFKLGIMILFLLPKTTFTAAAAVDKSQAQLIDAIALYLISELGKADSAVEKKNRQKMIDFFQKGGKGFDGVCLGLTFVWLYGKRLSDECATPTKSEKDDNDFFMKAYDALLYYDETIDLDENTKESIERFIGYILGFQHRFNLIDLSLIHI